ncbi:MAG: hypothetical protein KGY70_09295, partial [Bacteroidales bacterium]|nr:hypothetical protein [Bacteroidales bacterium]
KIEVLQRKVWYSESADNMVNPLALPLKRILEIAEENKHGYQPCLFAPEISGSHHSYTSSPGQGNGSKKASTHPN